MEFGRLFDLMTNLENQNKIKETKLPVYIRIHLDSFPKITSRYGGGWLIRAKELCNKRTNRNPTHKIYNDCLIETKPSWLMLERSELSDSPWMKVEMPSKDTRSLTLWDTSQLNHDLGKKTVDTY